MEPQPHQPDPNSKNGNRGKQLLRNAYPVREALVAYAYSVVMNWHHAEIVVQNTLRVVERRSHTFNAAEQTLLNWLQFIVKYESYYYLKNSEHAYESEYESIVMLMHELLENNLDEEKAITFGKKVEKWKILCNQLSIPDKNLMFEYYWGQGTKPLSNKKRIFSQEELARLQQIRSEIRHEYARQTNEAVFDENDDDVDIMKRFFNNELKEGEIFNFSLFLQVNFDASQILLDYLLDTTAFALASREFGIRYFKQAPDHQPKAGWVQKCIQQLQLVLGKKKSDPLDDLFDFEDFDDNFDEFAKSQTQSTPLSPIRSWDYWLAVMITGIAAGLTVGILIAG